MKTNREGDSNQDTNEITEEDINALDDFDAAFNYAEKMGVDLGGLDDLEDMVERMSMHYRKDKKREINPKKQIETTLKNIKKKDEQKRSKLQTLLQEMKNIFRTLSSDNDSNPANNRGSSTIEDLLKTEGSTKGLLFDIDSQFDSIKSRENLIVVSGETSAGKSTVVNLLLQEDILPTHTLSCTSVVTKISYGPVRRAKIVYDDKRRHPLTIELMEKDKLFQQVMDAIFIKNIDQREQLSDIKEVQLFVPSDILKSGLIFVDTPGIGENDVMDNIITKFVEANTIIGFIYVVKSNNAGGVQEDRLLGLIKLILDKQKNMKNSNSILPFDPKCAIFLCNFWDKVKKDEADNVYQHALEKLGQYWPGIDTSQVIRLSATKAITELSFDPGYIRQDYRLCLEGIRDLYQRAVDRRIKSTYKWIENILLRSTYHLKALVTRIDSSERDLEDKMKDVRDKLQRLRKKSDNVILKMRDQIRDASLQICKEFREYLRGPASRIAITQWIEDELPSRNDSHSWTDVKDEVDTKVALRIEEMLEKWEQTNQTVRRLEEQVIMDIKVQLHLLQDDLEAVEHALREDSNHTPSSDETFPNVYRDNRGRRQSIAAFKSRSVNLGSSSGDVLPIKLKTRVQNPMKNVMTRLKKRVLPDDFILARKLKAYKEHPCKTAKHRAEKTLNRLLDSKECTMLLCFVEGLLQEPNHYIKILEENIPGLIRSNEELMDHIVTCRVDAVDSRSHYEKMMEDMENLRSHLMEYGHGHIFVDDFMGEHITTNDELGKGESILRVSDILSDSSSSREERKKGSARGLWTALQNGFIKSNDTAKKVSVRVYLPSAGLDHSYPEVAKLRCIQHDHVAEFLGIHHSDLPIPALVYEHHLLSLRDFTKQDLGCPKEELPRIIVEIAHGIEYLHRKRMVHMELNVDTVTITDDGHVKLSGGCLPRHAAFPLDRETIEVGEFVYLAPEALNDELYVACADIYAFALLLFELFVGCPFSEQRKWQLDHFSSKVNPMEMLNLEESLSDFTEPMKTFIVQCLSTNPDSRPSTDSTLQIAKGITNETLVLSKMTNIVYSR